MNYYCFDNLPDTIYDPVGSGEQAVYCVKTFKDGHKDLIENGKENVYAKIQSHKNSQDINFIVERAQKTNNYELLQVKKGAFVDLLNMPNNLMEATSILDTANEAFYNLPTEIKSAFNNDPHQMVAQFDKGEMPKILDDYFKQFEPKPVPEPTKQEEVKE